MDIHAEVVAERSQAQQALYEVMATDLEHTLRLVERRDRADLRQSIAERCRRLALFAEIGLVLSLSPE
ncbi:hypothetical protein [Brevundimonas sp.]|uniref:hypothetical protein n=1 Tax=Brevundimonas sp. TaxID=1871086 RepID=UPI0025F49CF3|nr:hypothetical protein [Brevundimonas sp.]